MRAIIFGEKKKTLKIEWHYKKKQKTLEPVQVTVNILKKKR